MLVILVAFSGIVGRVAMPTLAAILILAAISSVRLERITMIWRTSSISKVAFATALLSTLFLSVPAAVGIGVAISLLLQLNQEALDLRLSSSLPTPRAGWSSGPPRRDWKATASPPSTSTAASSTRELARCRCGSRIPRAPTRPS
jgi:SulP family sulfate permease